VNHSAGYNNESPLEARFAGIFREHEQRLYTLAFRLTKSDQHARDIIQEVFLKLWECRETISTINNMEAWLYRVTENKIIDFMRKVAADDRLKDAIWNNLQQIINDAEAWIAVKEYNQIIQKAINQLPPQRKLIYQLHKEEGMNYQQIATQLHLSKHTVKNQLFSAVQSLRKFIARNSRAFLPFL